MTGLVMLGGDAAACEGDACLLPTTTAGPASPPTPVSAPTSERTIAHDDVEAAAPTENAASHIA